MTASISKTFVFLAVYWSIFRNIITQHRYQSSTIFFKSRFHKVKQCLKRRHLRTDGSSLSTALMSCDGSEDRTLVSHPRGPGFESTHHDSDFIIGPMLLNSSQHFIRRPAFEVRLTHRTHDGERSDLAHRLVVGSSRGDRNYSPRVCGGSGGEDDLCESTHHESDFIIGRCCLIPSQVLF